MPIQLPKGTRDFAPEEQILRDRIVSTLKQVFEIYGFAPLETPVIERYDVLASKYAGGDEILKETFKLRDQGKRELGLRYDLTVPLSRFIAMSPNVKMPFKRYQIGDVFRDGPTEKGRYRQFTQCDADIIGSREIISDAEVISLADSIFKKLNLNCKIKINSRKLLNDILLFCKIKKEKIDSVILSIDKLEKFGETTVKKELKEKGIREESIKNILELISIKGNNNDKLDKLKNIINYPEGLAEIEKLFGYLELMGVNAEFDVSLARGLSYYTGTVFEAVLEEGSIKSSVAGGGRYDNMIGLLVGKGSYPAVGISFGIDRIYDALKERETSSVKTLCKVYVISINKLNESLNIIRKLRENGINADIDLIGRGPSKNLEYANSLGIPFVIFVGEDEIKQNKLKLKNMGSGKEEMLDIDEVIIKLTKSFD